MRAEVGSQMLQVHNRVRGFLCRLIFQYRNLQKTWCRSRIDSASRHQSELIITDRHAADMAVDLRRVYLWKLPDAFQAALALHHKIKSTMGNPKDFDPSKFDFAKTLYTL